MAIQVIVDPSAGAGAGTVPTTQLFQKDEVSIGRNSQNDLVLADPQVSGKHAKLLCRKVDGAEKLFLVDVGSSNGTFLEDNRLDPNKETLLAAGKRVIIGGFILTCDVASAARPKKATPNVAAAPQSLPTEAPPSPKKAPTPSPADSQSARPSEALFEAELRIKRAIHDKLIQRLDLRRKDIAAISDVDLRRRAREVVEQILFDLRWEIPEGLDRERLINGVLNEALGLGPLEDLLADESCSEVMVNSFDQIYAERNGMLALTPHRFSSEQAVLAVIERILAPIGRRIDESSPLVDARLKDGSRVNAVIRPLAKHLTFAAPIPL